MRASKLIGAGVRNDANERIGEINEIILDKDRKVAAVVIGVGGFLGIGEREVALDFKSLRIERDNSAMTESGANVIKVNATKDQLKAAPAWTWDDRSGTSPTRTTPAPGGIATMLVSASALAQTTPSTPVSSSTAGGHQGLPPASSSPAWRSLR